MFKWPAPPTPDAPSHELADFAELTCWERNDASAVGLSKLLGRIEENDYSRGVPEEDETERKAEEAFQEIERRREACGDNYPFVIGQHGETIQLHPDSSNHTHIIYKYLLLATRLNMDTQRMHANIDGTLLFERLCADVARAYFGERAKSLVFGTSAGTSGFGRRIDELCGKLGEGDGFRSGGGTNARDGKLDVVVWTPFSDGLPSKLVAFGQCKTGTHYKDKIAQLQPDAFQSKWMRSTLASPPVRMFLISEALAQSVTDRRELSIDAGLLFDRCRIIDYCHTVSSSTTMEVADWTGGGGRHTPIGISCCPLR